MGPAYAAAAMAARLNGGSALRAARRPVSAAR